MSGEHFQNGRSQRPATRVLSSERSHTKEALEAYARIARNRTDLEAIAVVNEYGYRALKDKIEELGK